MSQRDLHMTFGRLRVRSILNFQTEICRAEGVGFEPTEPFGSPVFKTGAIDHSTTPPVHLRRQGYACACRRFQEKLFKGGD